MLESYTAINSQGAQHLGIEMAENNRIRYSELDWLRVILIIAVFIHHVLMPFNGDGWHIVNAESSKILDDVMVFFEQIRLQTLFFIAGAGSLILLQKTAISDFIASKFFRLFIPFLFAMILIIPPQDFYEHFTQYNSIFDAYQKSMFSFETNHLWFIEFLIVFMLLAIPINSSINTRFGASFIATLEKLTTKKHGLFTIVAVLIIMRGIFKSINASEDHSISNLSISTFFLFFFIAGMVFIKSKTIWLSLKVNRRANLMWFIISSLLFYAYYFPDFSPYFSLELRWMFWWMVCSLVSWSGLLTMLGYAIEYCRKTPEWLKVANELIYPFYILHQTIIVGFAFYIVQWQANIGIKSLSLLLLSLLSTIGICFLIRHFDILRFGFGLKRKMSN